MLFQLTGYRIVQKNIAVSGRMLVLLDARGDAGERYPGYIRAGRGSRTHSEGIGEVYRRCKPLA